MKIIFDLDGTLIDSRLRLYRLIKDLVPNLSLSFEQYWAMKRNKISNESILKSELNFSRAEINDFVKEWMKLIESPSYLQFDSVFSGMHLALKGLHSKADLFICTDRQLSEPVLNQLDSLNLSNFFKKTLVTKKEQAKESLIMDNLGVLDKKDWLIGDTGKDIQAGQALKIQTCAVLSGFLSRNALEPYNPDLILDSVLDFRAQ